MSWDLLTVFLTASEFYSFYFNTSTTREASAEGRGALGNETEQHAVPDGREAIRSLAWLPRLAAALCSATVCPFLSQRLVFQQQPLCPTKGMSETESEGKGFPSSKTGPTKSGHKVLCGKHPVFRHFSFLVTWDDVILVSFSAFAVFDYLCEKCRKRFLCINYSHFQFINHVFAPCLNDYCSLKQSGHA